MAAIDPVKKIAVASSSSSSSAASPAPSSTSSSSSSPRVPAPQSSLLHRLPTTLINQVGSSAKTHEIAHLRHSASALRFGCEPEMLERRRVTTELLPHVFNAKPEMVKAFFKISGVSGKLVLRKTCYNEGYDSKKAKKFICFRRWENVSSIQAAALSLDNFQLLDLLNYIKNDPVLREQAAKQLQEVLDRTAPPSSEATETKIKAETESKSKEEAESKTEAELADRTAYQAPFQALIKAYDNYIGQFDTLYNAQNWAELDRLWEVIGECHRRLPTYGHQEFFDNKPFSPIPLFTTPPHRGECRYWNESVLDLDRIGLWTKFGLYKGAWLSPALVWQQRCGGDPGRGAGVRLDRAAVDGLCKLRREQLENVVKCLLTPGVPVTLEVQVAKSATAVL